MFCVTVPLHLFLISLPPFHFRSARSWVRNFPIVGFRHLQLLEIDTARKGYNLLPFPERLKYLASKKISQIRISKSAQEPSSPTVQPSDPKTKNLPFSHQQLLTGFLCWRGSLSERWGLRASHDSAPTLFSRLGTPPADPESNRRKAGGDLSPVGEKSGWEEAGCTAVMHRPGAVRQKTVVFIMFRRTADRWYARICLVTAGGSIGQW